MVKENIQKLGNEILKGVGGKENINGLTHCMTRLRFDIINENKVNLEALKENSEIMTAQFSGGQLQVVIGTNVNEVYEEINKKLNSNENQNQKVESKKGLNRLIEIVTKVITPVLGVLVACGLLQGLLALLRVTGAMDENDGTFIVLQTMGQTAFFFFPVLLGYTSAKVFGVNKFVGMMLGGSIIFPSLLEQLTSGPVLYTLFTGTIFQTDIYKTFLGLPIIFPPNGYQYTVLPIIFIVYFASKVEKVVYKIIPDIIAHNLNAFFTLLITVPVSILVIGPVTDFLSAIIGAFTASLYSFSPLLTTAFVALAYQPLVIFGLHWPLSALGLNNLTTTGADYILPMSFTANFAQTAVVIAVMLRTKSKDLKVLAVPAIVSGIFCIIEPAIYGFSLPVKKRFLYSMLGGLTGGLIIALFQSKMYAFSFGILGIVSFINPETKDISGLNVAIIASIAAMIVPFLLTYFTFKKEDDVIDEMTVKKEEENA